MQFAQFASCSSAHDAFAAALKTSVNARDALMVYARSTTSLIRLTIRAEAKTAVPRSAR